MLESPFANLYETATFNDLVDYFSENGDDLKELQTEIEKGGKEAGFDWLMESYARDYVTGEADGSRTMNRERAKKEFENLDGYNYLGYAFDEGYIDDTTITNAFLDQNWEALDVICRAYGFDGVAREIVDSVADGSIK